jgi:hypothetical protein
MSAKVTKKQAEQVFSEIKKKYKAYIYEGSAPTLVKNFEWGCGPVEYAIVWDGGPYEWAYNAHTKVEGIYTEPYTSWAVAIAVI